MRISDWSSDVCSSDLGCVVVAQSGFRQTEHLRINPVVGTEGAQIHDPRGRGADDLRHMRHDAECDLRMAQQQLPEVDWGRVGAIPFLNAPAVGVRGRPARGGSSPEESEANGSEEGTRTGEDTSYQPTLKGNSLC